ncbi:GNAT family N-acetyltransferase [Sphingobium sp. LB126]|uniref:GNAT family N-acetyltransferase n=1 Tax=Sphingobium sp. LB126 TaxID=1983755 RepID=UPI000C20EF4D|nr:GNAT family N-acetyltransferase [Sphingobium sp. LB126]PJG46688.1 GNAT family N-acetyltransferase [Sphingobium sp. LB126]
MTELHTRTGFSFRVRPATAADGEALTAFFGQVSDEDRRFRFLSAVQALTQAQLSDLTRHEDQAHENYLALGEDGTILAVATLAADKRRETGEVAIAIRTDHKGRGIGWTLLDHVAQEAKGWGVKRLQSIESRENHAAIALEQEKGFTASPVEGEPTLMLLERTF